MALPVQGDQSPQAVVSRTPSPEPGGIAKLVYDNWKAVMAKEGVDAKALSNQCFQTVNILAASKARSLAESVFNEAVQKGVWLDTDRAKAYAILFPQQS